MTETLWDAPNQQAVRADQSAPWEEGSGGAEAAPKEQASLDSMSKAELLEHARERGVSPANNDMTKDELRAAIDEAAGG